jgi:membrane-bound serine protease (ClpP class)
MNKSLIRWVAAWFVLIMVIFTAPVGAKSTSPVYILPVKSTIDGGTLAFFERSYAQAQDNDAAAIVLEIDTPGGAVWAAVKIRNVIHKSPVPTIAFVEEGAISAGTLLALVSETIVMAPGSTMGAAEPQLGGQRADAKSVSYWVGQLETAAEENGRDELVARAMADADFELPGIVKKGEILTLTPNKALELGMIDAILASRQEVLQEYGLSGNPIVEMQPEFAEHFVRIVTNPYVSTALLTIGLVGLILEVFTPGFGVFGITGLISRANAFSIKSKSMLFLRTPGFKPTFFAISTAFLSSILFSS